MRSANTFFVRRIDPESFNYFFSTVEDEYKGLLKNVYLQNPGNPKPERKQAAEKPADQSSNPAAELPQIVGVTFENRQGVIVAIGEKLFDRRQQLKAAGFTWNKSEKVWMKAA